MTIIVLFKSNKDKHTAREVTSCCLQAKQQDISYAKTTNMQYFHVKGEKKQLFLGYSENKS